MPSNLKFSYTRPVTLSSHLKHILKPVNQYCYLMVNHNYVKHHRRKMQPSDWWNC